MNNFPVFISEDLIKNESWIENFIKRHLGIENIFLFKEKKINFGIYILNMKDSFESNLCELVLEFTGANLSLFNDSKHLGFKDEEEIKNFLPLLKSFIEASWEAQFNKLVAQSNVNYKNLENIDYNDQDIEELFLEKRNLFSAYDIWDLVTKFNNRYEKLKLKFLSDILISDEKKEIFLVNERLKVFLISEKQSNIKILLNFLYKSIEKLEYAIRKNTYSVNESIFFNLPYPVAIYNKEKELIVHNGEFSRLSITTRELVLFKNGETIDIDSIGKYQVLVKDLASDMYIVNFVKIEDFNIDFKADTSEELGIVSSSMAHELNNPLGGMLAALEVLLLDELEEDFEENIIQMKEGIFRCKELVEIFLSFSRKDFHLGKSEQLLSDIIEQVQRIARYRLIESNIQMKVDHELQSKMSCIKNSNLLTMAIYLIVGEILTTLSRESLIQDKIFNKLSFLFIEKEKKLEIHIKESVQLGESFFKSKLFEHILDQLEFEFKINKNKLTFEFTGES